MIEHVCCNLNCTYQYNHYSKTNYSISILTDHNRGESQQEQVDKQTSTKQKHKKIINRTRTVIQKRITHKGNIPFW